MSSGDSSANGGKRANIARTGRTGLVLAGGGARGAYQVGVLKAIGELVDTGPDGDGVNPFPIITGVSVGSINVGALASRARDFHAGVDWLSDLWSGLDPHDIYRTDIGAIAGSALHWMGALFLGGFGVRNPDYLLDASPLGELLKRVIDFDGARAAIDAGVLDAFAVTASSYADGRAKTFFQGKDGLAEWSRVRRDGLRTRIGVEHLLASSALPFIFQTQKIGDEYFGDGALRLTAPLSPAIHLGATRILVIGVRDESSERRAEPMRRPGLGDIAGYLLDVLFNDNLNADLERIERVNETLDLVTPEKRAETGLNRIEVLTIRPSVDIRDIAGAHAASLPRTIRTLLRGLGAWGPDWRLPSYLLFERGYCRALIDLGYRDAMAQQDTLRDFLNGQEAARP